MLQENSPLILIYFNFKGMAQIIRHLLCYLRIPFTDVLLDCVEEQKKTLPKVIFDTLKGLKIDKTMLPILVHEGNAIEQLLPIATYICLRYEREDLLGTDNFQKAKVQELMELLDSRLPQTHGVLLGVAQAVANIEDELLFATLEGAFRQVIRTSGYVREVCELLLKGGRQFVLGAPTIIDFFFAESAGYMLGMFSCLDKELARGRWSQRVELSGKRVRGVRCLRVMRSFRDFMEKQSYYRDYRDYLESFPLLGCSVCADKIKGIHRIWIS